MSEMNHTPRPSAIGLQAAETIVKGVVGHPDDIRCAALVIDRSFRGLTSAVENILLQHANPIHESDGEFQQRWEMAWNRLEKEARKVETVLEGK